MGKYVNLHMNTEYSLLESTIKINELIAFAIANKMDQLVITDHNVMYGVPEFVQKCKENNIKPIIGLELDVEDYRLILLAKNYDGYKELMRLSSLKLSGANISVDQINVADIFIIDHPVLGYYQKHKMELRLENYFVGLSKGVHPSGVYVTTANVITTKENEALKTLYLIKYGEMPKENFHNSPYTNKPEANSTLVAQAVVIANSCNVVFPKIKNMLPNFKTPNKETSFKYLRSLLKDYAKVMFANKKNVAQYIKRLEYEMKVIENLGFSDYFLIIWDFIKWAKLNGIIIGPGRGSSAGSLIAFLLNITEVDPIEFDLLFERFLNPERVSMPDIDIDIQDDRRDEVVKYIFHKYGISHSAYIITFQKLGAKMSLRDAARSLKIPSGNIDALSKLIPMFYSLEDAYKKVAAFRANIDRNESYTKLFEIAKSIEGLPRQIGTHAAGIVLTSEPIAEIIPIINTNSHKYNQTQYSMDYMEENGLLKIDLLGLRNLTIIKSIQDQIYNNFKKRVNLKSIKYNDPETNLLLSSADTNGIFQLESYGMKSTLAKVGVSSIDDIVAIISLYRPGPMDNIPTYISRKKGKSDIPKISKEFDTILKPTYGIIVYQEQIMQIAQSFAGMSFGQADILRRAISKKKHSLIQSLKKIFYEGAITKGHNLKTIESVYKNIEKFADYGFNKSHAVAYAIIAYRLAFLKARFPIEFYTSLLSSTSDSSKYVQTYINEAKSKKVKIVVPNVNTSGLDYFNKNDAIYLPLTMIKGFGSIANKKIIDEREKGLFKDFFDFVVRMRRAGVGKAVVALLIQANTLKDFGNMQSLIDSFPSASRYADMITTKKGNEVIIDFDLIAKPRLIETQSKISFEVGFEEKLYGFKLIAFETAPFQTNNTLNDLAQKKSINVAILVEKIKRITDKNGQQMARVLVSDISGKIELTIFSSVWKFIDSIKPKTIVIATIHKNFYNGLEDYFLKEPWKVVKNE